MAHGSDAAEIGVVGGSGFYSLLDDVREIKVDTPYGAPSDSVFLAEVAGRRVAFLPRHGRRHTIPPHKINYRANVWALRSLGVKAVISPCAAGSLQLPVKPGDFVVCDQFVDRTSGRADTFYDGPIVTHLSSAEIYDPVLRELAIDTIRDHGIEVHEQGTVVVISGPRFSTRSESKWFSDAGWEVINMTQYPEAWLCRELGMAVVNISLITDYDAGVLEGTRRGRRDERARGLPAERGADPGGRARPHRALPGRPRRARRARGARPDPRGRPRDGARGHPPVRDRPVTDGRLPIGVCLRTIRAEPGWWLDSARRLDAAGYAGLWAWDHFMGRGDLTVPVVEGWTILSMAAAATNRVTVAPFVLNVMNRHPAVVARMASTLQIASGGRLVLGIGIGGAPREHAAYGIDFPPPPERVARLEEAVAVIRALWTGGPVTRESPFYPLRDAYAHPIPDPPPPIIVGGETAAGARLAGRIGDGWSAFDDNFEANLPLYLESLAATGGGGTTSGSSSASRATG